MRLFLLLLICTSVLMAQGCRKHLEFTTPIPVDNSFTVGVPTPQERQDWQTASRYSEQCDGRALLILRDNQLLFEEYHHGHTAEKPHHIFSGTKSFAGVLAVAAVADGLLSLDEKVADTIAEFRQDVNKSRITVRHLLQFTSGLEEAPWALTLDGLVENQRIADKYRHALTMDAEAEPGVRFRYASVHLMVFGELMRRKLQGDPLAYLHKQVFVPIGFRYAGWNRDPSGNPMFPYGAWTTAREWAKFGLLLANSGNWRGQQVLPAHLLAECFQGSSAMPAYGLTFWLNQEIPQQVRDALPRQLRRGKDGRVICPQAPGDLVAAAGYRDNRLYLIPSRRLVIVRLGDGDRDFKDAEFLRLLLGKK